MERLVFNTAEHKLEELEKYGFVEQPDSYVRFGKRDVFIYKHNFSVVDYKKDKYTYSGYAYENEYKHNTKHYVNDLIKDGLVVKEKK